MTAAKRPARPKAKSPPTAAKAATKAPSKTPRGPAAVHPKTATLLAIVNDACEDMKAVNLKVLDVRGLTDIADHMVVASGNSDRHVRSIAERITQRAKQEGFKPYGTEGSRDGEWVLVDLPDVLVHVMLPRVREFYGLESLWEVQPKRREDATGASPARATPRRRKKSGAAASG